MCNWQEARGLLHVIFRSVIVAATGGNVVAIIT